MNNFSVLTIAIFVTIFIIAITFIIREIVCWYSKINERIELQKKTNDLLEKILVKLDTGVNNQEQKQIL